MLTHRTKTMSKGTKFFGNDRPLYTAPPSHVVRVLSELLFKKMQLQSPLNFE